MIGDDAGSPGLFPQSPRAAMVAGDSKKWYVGYVACQMVR
jgi:hypothetical protein